MTSKSSSSNRLQSLVRGICRALYIGVTPDEALENGELGYFSHWLVSPLSRNTYNDLVDNEVVLQRKRSRIAIVVSCTDVVQDPISPSSQQPSLSVSSSAILMAPPPPVPPAGQSIKRSASTPASRSVIPSLSKRVNPFDAHDEEQLLRSSAKDLNMSEERFAEIVAKADIKRRRHEIGVVSTSEFAATLEANRLNAEKASLQTNIVTTTAVKQEPLSDSGSDNIRRSMVLLKTSSNGSDAGEDGVTELHQITTNSVASESVVKTAAVFQFLQTTINEQFETTSVIGALAQLFLVVSLEPVDFSICLSFARRRNAELITDNLLDIFNSVANNTNSNGTDDAAPLDDTQILNTTNDRLTINFFSRFPELSIECKSLNVTVCQSIFSLASFATQVFERTGCTLSPQAEMLQRFKFNNIMNEELGDRSRLLKGLCHSAIVQIGGAHKTRLVTEMFSNALFCASERVHSLICRGRLGGLAEDNELLLRLSRTHNMLTATAREIKSFFLLKK